MIPDKLTAGASLQRHSRWHLLAGVAGGREERVEAGPVRAIHCAALAATSPPAATFAHQDVGAVPVGADSVGGTSTRVTVR